MNVNKFLAALEWILCLEDNGRISYEHCKLATMLLQCIPFAFDSGPPSSRTDLWQEKIQRQGGGRPVLSMGLKRTTSSLGYAWLLPRVDWEQLEFRRRIAHKIAFTSSMLRDTYRKNWERVRESKDDYVRIEGAGQWIERYWAVDQYREYITQFLLVMIMRSYRREVFRYYKYLFRPESYKQAREGLIMLCPASTREHFIDDTAIHLVDPRRIQVKNIQDLLELLWGFDNGINRSSWEDAPFRVLCRRACELIAASLGARKSAEFHELVGRYFVATHWLIPYPTPRKFTQKGKDKVPLWIGLSHWHLSLKYEHAERGMKIRPTTALKTTIPKPVVFRLGPRGRRAIAERDSIICRSRLLKKEYFVRTARWYMPHWWLSDGKEPPFLNLFAVDHKPRGPTFDGDLGEISRALEAWYQLE
jgi:hypothetical protein